MESGKRFREKVDLLIGFYEKENVLDRSQGFMGSSFYCDAWRAIKKQNKEIESGQEATIFKMPKS